MSWEGSYSEIDSFLTLAFAHSLFTGQLSSQALSKGGHRGFLLHSVVDLASATRAYPRVWSIISLSGRAAIVGHDGVDEFLVENSVVHSSAC